MVKNNPIMQDKVISFPLLLTTDRISGVMDGVPATSVVYRRLSPRSSQTNDNTFGICCFSEKYAALWSKSKY